MVNILNIFDMILAMHQQHPRMKVSIVFSLTINCVNEKCGETIKMKFYWNIRLNLSIGISSSFSFDKTSFSIDSIEFASVVVIVAAVVVCISGNQY